MYDWAASYWIGEECGASFGEGVSVVGLSVSVVVDHRVEGAGAPAPTPASAHTPASARTLLDFTSS